MSPARPPVAAPTSFPAPAQHLRASYESTGSSLTNALEELDQFWEEDATVGEPSTPNRRGKSARKARKKLLKAERSAADGKEDGPVAGKSEAQVAGSVTLAKLECPICTELMVDCVVSTCGHSFCQHCSLQLRSNCPNCRAPHVRFIPNYFVRELIAEVATNLSARGERKPEDGGVPAGTAHRRDSASPPRALRVGGGPMAESVRSSMGRAAQGVSAALAAARRGNPQGDEEVLARTADIASRLQRLARRHAPPGERGTAGWERRPDLESTAE